MKYKGYKIPSLRELVEANKDQTQFDIPEHMYYPYYLWQFTKDKYYPYAIKSISRRQIEEQYDYMNEAEMESYDKLIQEECKKYIKTITS